MIKEVTCFTVICDNCGKDAGEHAEYSCWGDKNYAEEDAIENDWIKDGEKHYCPDCTSYDEEDNLIIKKVVPKV